MFDYFNFVLNCFINRNDDLFLKKIKNVIREKFLFCLIDYRDVYN